MEKKASLQHDPNSEDLFYANDEDFVVKDESEQVIKDESKQADSSFDDDSEPLQDVPSSEQCEIDFDEPSSEYSDASNVSNDEAVCPSLDDRFSTLANRFDVLEESCAKLRESVDSLAALLTTFGETQRKTNASIAETFREFYNFRNGVYEQTRAELQSFREQNSRNYVEPSLRALAETYCEYLSLLDDETLSAKTRGGLVALFETLKDVLIDSGAEIVESQPGDVRPPLQCRLVEKIPTGDQSKLNMIARCRRPGVVYGKITLSKQWVDVYVYDSTLTESTKLNESNVVDGVNEE